ESGGTTKLQMAAANDMFRGPGGRTPKPDGSEDPEYGPPYPIWDYDAWWAAYWADKHAAAGVTPAPPAPEAPAWPASFVFGQPRQNIPNFMPYDPENPSLGSIGGGSEDLKFFEANVGGTNARTGVRCFDGSNIEPSERESDEELDDNNDMPPED